MATTVEPKRGDARLSSQTVINKISRFRMEVFAIFIITLCECVIANLVEYTLLSTTSGILTVEVILYSQIILNFHEWLVTNHLSGQRVVMNGAVY